MFGSIFPRYAHAHPAWQARAHIFPGVNDHALADFHLQLDMWGCYAAGDYSGVAAVAEGIEDPTMWANG